MDYCTSKTPENTNGSEKMWRHRFSPVLKRNEALLIPYVVNSLLVSFILVRTISENVNISFQNEMHLSTFTTFTASLAAVTLNENYWTVLQSANSQHARLDFNSKSQMCVFSKFMHFGFTATVRNPKYMLFLQFRALDKRSELFVTTIKTKLDFEFGKSKLTITGVQTKSV